MAFILMIHMIRASDEPPPDAGAVNNQVRSTPTVICSGPIIP